MLYFTNKNFDNVRELLYDFLFPDTKFTFYDKELTEFQCDEGKYRSISELLEIVQTYLPEITLEELLYDINRIRDEVLENATFNTSIKYPVLLFCPDVNKVVLAIWSALSYTAIIPLFYTRDYTGGNSSEEVLNKEGVDGYNLKKLKEILYESL